MTSSTSKEPSDKQLKKLYPEVDIYARRMRRELWRNRYKGNQTTWRTMGIRQAWAEISWHLGKLTAALKAGDIPKSRELLADIGNGAMMLDDIIGSHDSRIQEAQYGYDEGD